MEGFLTLFEHDDGGSLPAERHDGGRTTRLLFLSKNVDVSRRTVYTFVKRARRVVKGL